MKIISVLFICLFSLVMSAAYSEVGQTNVIDAIATKPGAHEAILLLHQSRPWNDESIELFNKKVSFYAEAISSESLIKEQPGLQGKAIRIIVIYRELPTQIVEARLNELKITFAKSKVAFVWGEQKDIATLATKL